MLSLKDLNFPLLYVMKKNNFLRKIKGLLYSLKKHSKILPSENSGDF